MSEKPECRVLQVFGNLGTGGAETWLIALLKYFKNNEEYLPVRLSIHIFLTSGFKSDFDDEAESLGATLHYSKYSRSNLIGFVRDWRKVLSQYDFHVIHDHQENTAGMHFLMGVGYLPNVRIAHLHNPMLHLRNYSSSLLRRLTLQLGKFLVAKLGTHILATSKQLMIEQGFMKSMFNKLIREPVYCGFDPSRFMGDRSEAFQTLRQEFNWPEDCKILLFVGRLNSAENEKINQKNPAFALDVARNCIRKDPKVRFLMVGGGEPVLSRLKKRVSQWGLEDKITLAGQRSDVPNCMLGSHLLVLSSLAEGLGMVVVEAQAAGLSSIVSDTTPRECSVVHSMVEFMSLEDGASTWAYKVLDMISESRSETEIGNQAVQASDFSIENSASNLLSYYTGQPDSLIHI